MANAEPLRIEVVYALPEQQEVVTLSVSPGTTLRQAVEQSGLAMRFGFDPASVSLGIFGKLAKAPDTELVQEGDRVEIYRPLTIDPKAARAARAAKAKAKRATK